MVCSPALPKQSVTGSEQRPFSHTRRAVDSCSPHPGALRRPIPIPSAVPGVNCFEIIGTERVTTLAAVGKSQANGRVDGQGGDLQVVPVPSNGSSPKVVSKSAYEKELARLQTELVRMQEWIVHRGLRVMVIFEGRDTAGKGGTIKRIMERLNARYCRVVALGTPTDRERSQWYFQRYIAHLPAAGEMVLFDRSWYNRAGVERVMEFCTPEEHAEFFRTCPQLERALVRSGIILVKYWLSLSDEEQERRFTERINNPGKRWKLSPMDLEARARWVDYAEAKDEMFSYTDIKEAPVVRRRRRRQEVGTAQHHQPSSRDRPL